MKSIVKLVAAVSVFMLAACDTSNNNRNDSADFETVPLSTFQVLHASPDAPAVNVFVDGDEALSGVDYRVASPEIATASSSITVRVDGILPGGTATVIGPADISFSEGSKYTIAAVNACGDAGCSGIEPVVIEQPASCCSPDSARLFVFHATPGESGSLPVNVYVTGPDEVIDDTTAVTGTFDFKETLGPVEVPAGTYRVRVTPASDTSVIAYDSGAVDLADGTDLVLAAVPNTSGGPALVTLVGLDAAGSFDLLDIRTPTALRVGHLSPDTGLVDVVVDGDTFLDNVGFPAVTGFAALDPAIYNVAVTDSENQGAVAIGPVDLALEAGNWYSVLAVGFNAEIGALIEVDDPRPVATHAKVRIIHAAATPAAALVDIYLTAPGASIDDIDPTLADVPFQANTGYLPIPAGDYWVHVAVAGTKTVAIGPAPVTVDNGGVYTAIARDPEMGAMDFGLIVLADSLGN